MQIMGATDYHEAAEALARLINREFGGRADAVTVKRVIRDKWGTLTALAHSVHDGVTRPNR